MDAGDFEIVATRESLRAFESALLEFMAVSGKGLGQVLRQQARLIAVNLAYNTQPYGVGQDARKKGENAVTRDVGRVYKTLDQVFALIAQQSEDAARGFFQAALAGRTDVVKHILRGCGLDDLLGAAVGSFDPAYHQQLRDRRGRVNSRTRPRQIVTDPKELAKYRKLVVSRVGFAKSSFAECARQLGGVRGIPHWAAKNRGPGSVQDLSQRRDDPRVILSSRVSYIDTVLPESARRDALDKQREKMRTAITRTLEKSARQARLAA